MTAVGRVAEQQFQTLKLPGAEKIEGAIVAIGKLD